MVPQGIGADRALAVLCGPTAIGKTAVAVPLARQMQAEIVCADSRTIYRRMDIGTAKPTPQQRQQVPHHLLDIADPADVVTLADYQREARDVLETLWMRGRWPLVVGGTGLYVRALVDDLTIPAVPPDPVLRAELDADGRRHGRGHLHARLAALDPVAASRIHPHNTRRVIRALEVTLRTGRPISAQQHRRGPSGPVAMVGLATDRAALYRRIEARITEQLTAGLVDEVRRLLVSGVPRSAPSMQGLGYKEIAGWLEGEYGEGEAVRRLARNTRGYAKRQLTWFRRDARVRWVEVADMDAGDLATRVHAIMDAEFSRQGRG
jgi:tRNA dimethylallyltransferase